MQPQRSNMSSSKQSYVNLTRSQLYFKVLTILSGGDFHPNTPTETQPACERGILAKHPPGRRRKAAEKAGSKDFMTPIGTGWRLTCVAAQVVTVALF